MPKQTPEQKAATVIELEMVKRDDQFEDIYWVSSLTGPTTYRVQFVGNDDSEIVTCTCPHGIHAMGDAQCYHALAAQGVRRAATQA